MSEELLGPVLNFFHSMAAISVTDTEYALLVATSVLCSGLLFFISLFSFDVVIITFRYLSNVCLASAVPARFCEMYYLSFKK